MNKLQLTSYDYEALLVTKCMESDLATFQNPEFTSTQIELALDALNNTLDPECLFVCEDLDFQDGQIYLTKFYLDLELDPEEYFPGTKEWRAMDLADGLEEIGFDSFDDLREYLNDQYETTPINDLINEYERQRKEMIIEEDNTIELPHATIQYLADIERSRLSNNFEISNPEALASAVNSLSFPMAYRTYNAVTTDISYWDKSPIYKARSGEANNITTYHATIDELRQDRTHPNDIKGAELVDFSTIQELVNEDPSLGKAFVLYKSCNSKIIMGHLPILLLDTIDYIEFPNLYSFTLVFKEGYECNGHDRLTFETITDCLGYFIKETEWTNVFTNPMKNLYNDMAWNQETARKEQETLEEETPGIKEETETLEKDTITMKTNSYIHQDPEYALKYTLRVEKALYSNQIPNLEDVDLTIVCQAIYNTIHPMFDFLDLFIESMGINHSFTALVECAGGPTKKITGCLDTIRESYQDLALDFLDMNHFLTEDNVQEVALCETLKEAEEYTGLSVDEFNKRIVTSHLPLAFIHDVEEIVLCPTYDKPECFGIILKDSAEPFKGHKSFVFDNLEELDRYLSTPEDSNELPYADGIAYAYKIQKKLEEDFEGSIECDEELLVETINETSNPNAENYFNYSAEIEDGWLTLKYGEHYETFGSVDEAREFLGKNSDTLIAEIIKPDQIFKRIVTCHLT